MRLFLLVGVLLLNGCALLSSPPAPVARPTQADAAFALNGRIAIRHHDVRHSAGLRWVHQVQSDEVLLLTPLGQTAARVYRDASGATLEDGDKRHQAADAESLMEQVMGWHLPLGGLHRWVLALPMDGSEAEIERDAGGRIALLRQNGWEVRYLRYADASPDSLPTRLQLNRDVLQVQILIDEWELL
ncbi:MAG: lipoprotein insertase outer membrane protein LolB [Gallionella sp.]|nr:lipoprotein insertase outer membrane protein LolB [Gallionella sp.]